MDLLKDIKITKNLIKKAKFFEAEIILKAMPEIEENPQVQHLLGVVALQTNRAAVAVIHFKKAVIQLPQDAYLHNNLAQAYKVLGLLTEAKLAFEKAAQYQPSFAEPLNQLGLLLMQEEKRQQAEAAFLSAISRQTNYAEAHYNLAVLLEGLGRLPEALVHYQNAIETKPDYIQAINNLGTVLDDLGEHKAAEGYYRRGILTSPNTPELYCSLGSCLSQQGKYLEALKKFQKAKAIAPNFAINKWNLGFLQLATSELSEGWENYRFRHTVDRLKFLLPNKRLATKLTGQTFRIAAEQGLGDQIFFARFLRELKNRGAVVKFQPDNKIKTLFQRVEGVIVEDFNKPDISIADLPYLLGNNAAVPSLLIEPEKEAKLRILARLADCGPAPYIGITYRAGNAGVNTLVKDSPPEAVSSILSEISATVIIVQRQPTPKELLSISSSLGRKAFDFSDVNENLEDALALMGLLDDYIGVSNTNMHLRAAAGRSARVLVTHPGEFRWQVVGNTSPWFPEFILYRQGVDSSWKRSFTKLKIDLKEEYE